MATEALRQLSRDEWWDSVHDALDDLDATEVAAYQSDSSELDETASDGLTERRENA